MVREPIILQIFRGPSANVRNLSAVPRSTNAERGGAISREGRKSIPKRRVFV